MLQNFKSCWQNKRILETHVQHFIGNGSPAFLTAEEVSLRIVRHKIRHSSNRVYKQRNLALAKQDEILPAHLTNPAFISRELIFAKNYGLSLNFGHNISNLVNMLSK